MHCFPSLEVDIKLADSLTLESWDDEVFDLGEDWKSWDAIPADVLEKCGSNPCVFLTQWEIAMIMPRYLTVMSSKIKPTDGVFMGIETLVSRIAEWIQYDVFDIIFTKEQRDIIIECIDIYRHTFPGTLARNDVAIIDSAPILFRGKDDFSNLNNYQNDRVSSFWKNHKKSTWVNIVTTRTVEVPKENIYEDE